MPSTCLPPCCFSVSAPLLAPGSIKVHGRQESFIYQQRSSETLEERAGGERELLLPPLGPCNKLNGSSKEGSECHISARATQGQVSICTKRKGMQKSLILMQLCREKPPSPQPQQGGGGCAWQPGHLLWLGGCSPVNLGKNVSCSGGRMEKEGGLSTLNNAPFPYGLGSGDLPPRSAG